MLSKGLETVVGFCLEQAELAPLKKRASLYRGLAEICGSPQKAAEFCTLAEELEAAEKHSRRISFDFFEETLTKK
jgi:hypothetical protein